MGVTRVEIGGGEHCSPGFVNLDPAHGAGDLRRRAQDGPWPFADGSVDAVRACHCMEHIPAGEARVFVMNEAWRVLRPGGTFEIVVPLFGAGWGAIADPTHVSLWVRESFDYFTGAVRAGADYGIRLWTLDAWTERDCGWGIEGRAVLRKP